MIENELIETIKAKLDQFQLIENTKVEQTNNGQFKICVVNPNKAILIKHSWGDSTYSYENPTSIDVLLDDKTNTTSYVIYMTESQLVDFPKLLAELLELTSSFLAGKYEIKSRKRFGIFKQTVMEIKNPKLVYTEAIATKEYHPVAL